MANGTLMQIQNIQAGDVVLSYNTQTGKIYPNIIQEKLVYNVSEIYIINSNTTTDGAEVFYTMHNNNESWISASNLRVGDSILNPITNKYTVITSIITESKNKNDYAVYDLVGSQSNNFIANNYLADAVTAPTT
jgi:hypothetical protein